MVTLLKSYKLLCINEILNKHFHCSILDYSALLLSLYKNTLNDHQEIFHITYIPRH